MANVDSPRGFEFVRHADGNSEMNVVHLDIDAAVVGTIARGQPCKRSDATGNIIEIDGATFGNDADSNGTGIFIAQKACIAGETGVPFVDARDAIFRVQADDDAAWTTEATLKIKIGDATWYGITNPNAISTDGLSRSTAELDGNGTHVTDNYLRIVNWEKDPTVVFGPFQKVHVRFNPRLFEFGTNFSQVNT